MFLARMSYVLMMTLICLHQILKYLYIFKWEQVAYWNENFFSCFLALASFLWSTIFTIVGNQNEHYKLSAEFHLCVGFYLQPNESLSSSVGSQPKDPIHVFSYLVFTVVLVLAFRITLYTHKYFILTRLKRLSEILKIPLLTAKLKTMSANSDSMTTTTTTTSFRDLFVDAGITLAITVTVFAVIFVSAYKETLDYTFFNSSAGRIYIYAMKVAMPAMPTVVLPLLVILKNPKMKEMIWRRIQWIRKASSPDQLYDVNT